MTLEGTAVAIERVEPVGIGLAVPRLHQLSVSGRRLVSHILLGVHQVGLAGQRGDAVGEIVEGTGIALLAFLGRDEHDAVTGLGSVDGSRSAVLENLHRLHRRRIEVTDIAHLQTIDDVKRIRGARTVRRKTADTDRRSRIRSSGSGENRHTGRLALQSLLDIFDRAIHQRVILDRRNRPRHVALTLHAVTDHHHIVEQLRILFQRDRDGCFRPEGGG